MDRTIEEHLAAQDGRRSLDSRQGGVMDRKAESDRAFLEGWALAAYRIANEGVNPTDVQTFVNTRCFGPVSALGAGYDAAMLASVGLLGTRS